jgi:hypothetical protein
MKERWMPVAGREGLYEVSSRGRVRSVDRVVLAAASTRRPAHLRRYKGQFLTPGRNTKQGHLSVAIGKGRSRQVHALVLEAFVGPRPLGSECLHNNGDAGDNRLCNLRYGTRAENNRDISKHGRRRLTAPQIKRFREERMSGAALRVLAEKYGVCLSQASNIASGKHYAHI